MADVLVFNKYTTDGIDVEDPGIKPYIGLDAKVMPKASGRYAGNRFYKSDLLIVERLINKLMVTGHRKRKHVISSGHQTGKHTKMVKIVEEAFSIVEEKLDMNPIAVLVKGVEYAAPREEIITIEYGGARYPKAVECAPQRRVDITLKAMAQATRKNSFRSKKNAATALADEMIAAYNKSSNSAAISQKIDLERQADSSR